MKSLKDFLSEKFEVKESASDEKVYCVYYDDGTLENFYNTKEEAEAVAKKEDNNFKCTIKEEPKEKYVPTNESYTALQEYV